MRYIHILIIPVVLTLLPTSVYACSGFVDCIFGFTERTEVRADRDIEKARIQAESDREIANIEALADERVKQAEAAVEQVKQQRFESEAARDIAIAQAQAQADQYKAMVAAWTDERVAGINSNANTQITALQEQAKIATAGIAEAGSTERWRIAGGWGFSIVALFILGVLVAAAVRRQKEPTVIYMLPGQSMGRLPQDAKMIQMILEGQVVRYEE